MNKTPIHLDADEALQVLRSSPVTFGSSFSQELEGRLMGEQMRVSQFTGRRIATTLLILFGVLIAGGGAFGYAASRGWLPWVFEIDGDGTVTNSHGEVVGTTYENDDGSATTVIGDPDGIEYRIRTEEPLNGSRLVIEPVENE